MSTADTRKTRYLTMVLAVVLATAVLLLSWPRLRASYRYLPIEIALQAYFTTREIPSARLDVLIRFARQAVAWHDHYRYHDGLSLLYLLRAVDVNTLALQRRDAYQAAADEAMAAVQRAPAQPAVWMRLANIRWTLHDEPETILTPWKMSILTGRTDSSLLAQRVELGLAHREYLDAEAVAMLRDQLLLAWRLQPGSVMRVLALRDPELAVTRALVQNTDPLALTEMEAWLEKLR
jgi:hypothetical protein